MDKMELPWWMSGTELTKIKNAAQRFFNQLQYWLSYPLRQIDPLTCDVGVLDLIAWERSIDRFAGEPMDLYRRRVKYAYVNARDAGSTAGFQRIFERLGIGYMEMEERIEGQDWDVIRMHITDNQVAGNEELLNIIVRLYGRTCRRYQITSITSHSMTLRPFVFNHRQQCFLATE